MELIFCVKIFAILITLILLLKFFYIKKVYHYWESHGIPTIKPTFPYGNLTKSNYNIGRLMQNIYEKYKKTVPFCGLYLFTTPMALAVDINFIKNVLITDFSYFCDRGFYYNEKIDPLTYILFRIEGQEWKNLRKKYTPTFTGSKIKYMHSTIIKETERLKEKCFENMCPNGTMEIDIKDLIARFVLDMIGFCIFDINCNCLINPNAEFRKMTRIIFEKPKYSPNFRIFTFLHRKLTKMFRIKSILVEVEEFFIRTVKDILEYREKSNIANSDFLSHFKEMMIEEGECSNDKEKLIKRLAAMMFEIFLAAYESTANVITYALYELALNQDIQTRAREEIVNVLRKSDNKLTYEALLNLPYIQQILNESLRKYPSCSILFREVKKNYNVPGTKYILPKGTPIWIPVFGIHRDSQYYPEPDTFNPDRFTNEEVEKRDNMTYMPFGHGPRSCLGDRFAMLLAKTILTILLQNYSFSKVSRTELAFAEWTIILTIKGPVWLGVKKLDNIHDQ